MQKNQYNVSLTNYNFTKKDKREILPATFGRDNAKSSLEAELLAAEMTLSKSFEMGKI